MNDSQTHINSWTKRTLGSVADVIKDSWKVGGEFSNYIGLEHINIETLTINSIGDSSRLASNKYRFKQGDILFGKLRPYFRKVVIPDFDGVCSTDIWVIRAKENYDQKYLFYFMANPILIDKSMGASTGTHMPRADWRFLEKTTWSFPALTEQQSIAFVLSSFDNKIELLRNQNTTLEEMAQALFKEWFVKNDWETQRLGDLVEVKRGGSPRPIQEYISESGLRWLKISDASATVSPYIFKIKEHIKEEGLKKTTLLKTGSLVLSNSATPGIPKILAVDSCIHDGWLHFPKSRFSNEFLYLLFQEIRPKLIKQGSGSVFTNLKTDILKDYEAPLPDDGTLQKFDNAIKPIFEKIYRNAHQIQTLNQLRDTLLPKLMSGEVRVI